MYRGRRFSRLNSSLMPPTWWSEDTIRAISASTMSLLAFLPRTCSSASLASEAGRPRCRSQRGESGRRDMPNISTAAGTAAVDSKLLHPSSWPKMTYEPRYPSMMPPTMKPSLRDISNPRTDGGAVSAMYIGAACMAKPIPKPYVNLPIMSTPSDGARPWTIAPAP